MNFYKHFIGDYARDTAHLSMLEHAAYRMLLDHYYATEKPLPMPAQCQRICRASTEAEKAAVKYVVETFFPEGVNKRADKEIKDFRDYANAQAMRAHKRWHSNGTSDGNASHSHSHSHKKTKEEASRSLTLPSWVPEDAWKAWLEVRPKVKAPNTPKALGLALRELERLRDDGNDPRAVLEQAALKGWRGLFPAKAQATTRPMADC